MNGVETLLLGLILSVSQPSISDRSAECLALNMYHEARGQGIAGELAVTAVVLNRVNDKRYPNTICEVVEEGPTQASWQDPKVRFPVKNRCQFSWFCDGESDTPRNKKIYNRMYNLADAILDNEIYFLDITGGATHYHANYVLPAWAETKTKTVEIQDHIFYRWEKND